MNPKSIKEVTFLEIWLVNLVLPIGNAQPSLVILTVTASFVMAFGLTCCFVGTTPKASLSSQTAAAPLGMVSNL